MLQTNKNSMFVLLFFIIYPVIPQYFGVAGISMLKLTTLFAVMLWSGLHFPGINGTLRIKRLIIVPTISYLVLVTVMSVCYTYHQELMPLFYELISYVLIIPIGISCIKNKVTFLKAIDCLITVSVIIAILGIVESFADFNVFSLLNNMGNSLTYNPLRFGMKRITSFTFQTISYCSYCMFMLSLIFYRLAGTKGDKRGRYIVAYLLVAVNSILTLSRSLILCTILCQVLLLWCCGYKKFIKRMITICLSLMAGCVVLSMAIPQVGTLVQTIGYMLLAVFNDHYAALLGNVDGTGIGDRADLYDWVFRRVGNDIWMGKGVDTPFSYSYTITSAQGYSYERTKTSLENQYLLLFYQYGIIGLAATVSAYVSLLYQGLKKITRQKSSWEHKISFGQMALVTFFCYFISFFSVHQIDEKRIFVCMVILFISYCVNSKFDYVTLV